MSLDELIYVLEEISRIINEAENAMGGIMEILSLLTSLMDSVIFTIGLVGTIISAVCSFVVAMVIFIIKAIPVYTLAKRKGRKRAWMAWIPIFPGYFRWYVMMDTAGDKPFQIFRGKISYQDRVMVFWVRVFIVLFGSKLVSALGIVLGFIPYIGSLGSMLAGIVYLALNVISGMIGFVFLRDVLDLYRPDKKANRIVSIVIVALDTLVTGGFAETLWLYLTMRNQPLPEEKPTVECLPE